MNRKEFLERRSRMDFERRVGVTQCPPGEARTVETKPFAKSGASNRFRNAMARVGQNIMTPPTDLNGVGTVAKSASQRLGRTRRPL